MGIRQNTRARKIGHDWRRPLGVPVSEHMNKASQRSKMRQNGKRQNTRARKVRHDRRKPRRNRYRRQESVLKGNEGVTKGQGRRDTCSFKKESRFDGPESLWND